MALKAQLTTEEFAALNDSLKDYYRPTADGYALDVEGAEDVSSLKNALRRQQEENKRVREQMAKALDPYRDIDPEQARQALARMKELEEADLLKKGEVETLFEKRLAPIKQEHASQLKALQEQIAERDARLAEVMERYSKTARSALLAAACAAAKVDPDWVEYVELKAQPVWRLDEQGELTAFGPDQTPIFGKDGRKITPVEWILTHLAKEKPKILLQSSGGGAPGGAARSLGRDVVLSPTEALDVERYRAAKQQAERQGGRVVTQ